MDSLTTQVISSGPDWITATGRNEDESSLLQAVFRDFLDQQQVEDIEVKNWSRLGYHGLTARGVSIGARADNQAMLIASGPSTLLLNQRALPATQRVTRFDVQVSVEQVTPRPNLAMLVYHDLQSRQANRKRQRYYKLIQSNTGDTLYVNKRTSQIMLRLYDKSLDYGHSSLGRVWRYEVELKGNAAMQAFTQWRVSVQPDAWSMGLVAGEYQKRDIAVSEWRNSAVSSIKVQTTLSNAQSKLSWLIRCVRPVMVQLNLAGYRTEAIQALGIQLDNWQEPGRSS